MDEQRDLSAVAQVEHELGIRLPARYRDGLADGRLVLAGPVPGEGIWLYAAGELPGVNAAAGLPISGPLLIPSISSKGFPIDDDGLSESGAILPAISPDLDEALLISAYDIHYRHIPDVDDLLGSAHHQSIYGSPQLLVVDSGGYELNPVSFESGETQRSPHHPEEFTRDDFERVVDKLPKDRDILVASYDHPEFPRSSYREQREAAQQFFNGKPFHSDFLLKPQGEEQVIDIAALTPEAQNLRCFDVIGVTEKELGDPLLDRLKTLAQLRSLLNNSGCGEIPIHVFGSLDPLLTPLYFMAGAEIFDGLSWLRYAYIRGLSLHRDQLAVLLGNLSERQKRRDLYRLMSNIAEIKNLKHRLERWANEPERYEHLGDEHERLRQAYDTMLAQLAQGG